MSDLLPTALVRSIRTANVLPVVGWGYPDLTRLRAPVPGIGPVPTEELRRAAEAWFDLHSPALLPLYQTIAELPLKSVIAITPDTRLVRTLEYSDSLWTSLHEGQKEYSLDRRVVIPLCGSLDDPESLALTERQYLSLDQRALWSHAQGQAAQYPLLVLGCDPSDPSQLNLLWQLRPKPDFDFAGWILCRSISQSDQIACEQLGFEIVQGHPARFLRDLARVSTDSDSRRQRGHSRRSGSPYKQLDYFERSDADIFFGRESEVGRLIELVCSHRLVIVSGPSGAGKTSLINAGLLAWTDRSQTEVGVYVRVGDDPVSSVRDGVFGMLGKRRVGDEPIKALLLNARNTSRRVPIIVLDQAEEMFTRIGSPLNEEFVKLIREALVTTPLIARFVLCLRDDYLPRLAEWRKWLPSILQNVFYLRELERTAALEAIVGPAEQLRIKFDDGLAEQIVSELGTTAIAPPQIQIVCSRLFSARDKQRITRKLYSDLGGAEALLRTFLAEEMAHLKHREGDVRDVLKALITAEGTKEPLTVRDVSKRSRVDETLAQEILLELRDHSRLVRTIHVGREVRFELAHEYLTRNIRSWMTPDEMRRREAEGLMEREIRSWRRFKRLRLGLDRLRFFEANKDLIDLDVEALVLLLLSSVKNRQAPSQWVQRVRSFGREAEDLVAAELFHYFEDRDLNQRRDAAETIAAIDREPLLRALKASRRSTRLAALEMIGGLELKEAVGEIADMLERETDPAVRAIACGALGEIRTEEAGKILRTVSHDKEAVVMEAVIRAAGRQDLPLTVGLVRDGLNSTKTNLNAAAIESILLSRSRFVVETLLGDPKIDGAARERLWSAIGKGKPALLTWVSLALENLPPRDLKRAADVGDLKRAALKLLAQGKGADATKAREELNRIEQSDRERVNDRSTLVTKLDEKQSVAEIASAIKNEPMDVWAVAERISTFRNRNGLILAMLTYPETQTRICGWVTVSWKVSDCDISERLFRAGLKDSDPTIRYHACEAARGRRKTPLADVIAPLTFDQHTSARWFTGIGPRVSDAANHAMDELAPNSKVWRKPFQTLFGAREEKRGKG